MKLKIAILFFFVYCMTLMANLPATFAISFIPTNAIKISHVTGTLWKGEAKRVSVSKPNIVLHDVKWDIALLNSLFHFNLEVDVSFYNGVKAMSGEGTLRYASEGFSVDNVLLDISSEELVPLLPMSLPAEITGNFSFIIKEFVQAAPYCERLDGKVTWHDAYVSNSFGGIDLDSPVVDLTCIDGNVLASLVQQSDHLSTNLNISLSAGKRYQVSGEVKGTSQLAPSIAKSLAWVGPVNEAGATEINFKGKL